MWSHSAWGGVPSFSTGEGTGTMSNTPSWEYGIMQRHLSSSCAQRCCICLMQLYKGCIFPRNLVQLKQYIMVKWGRVWIKPHTIGFHPPLCGLLQHTNQSVLLFLTHLHLHDPFFVTSQRSAACEGRGETNGVNDLLTFGDAQGLLKARRESHDQQRRRQLEGKSWSLATQA